MKLYEIEKGSKIYADCSDGSRYFVFDHLDGMYSYCIPEVSDTPIHLSASTPLKKFKDGYKIDA